MQPSRVRWWPGLAILVLMAVSLAWVWLREAGSTQDRVMPSLPIIVLGLAALFLWLVLFSRLTGRIRLLVLLVGVGIAAAGALLFEIRGVDGNLVPVVGFRFAAEPDFDTTRSRAAVEASTDDYPQFYGPGRLATLDDPGLARDWNSSPPELLWRREVGAGWSSFAVVGDAAVTQEQRGDEEAIVRYDLHSGEQVWVHTATASFETTVGGSGPRATPTVADGTVFALGATGILSALSLDSGELLWTRNVLEDRQATQPVWGTASSPLVLGELVLIQPGPTSRGLVAYQRSSGEPAWHVGDDTGTYTSPQQLTLAGREQVVVFYQDTVASHDPVEGTVLWRHPWAGGGERVSLPLGIGENRLLVSAGYGQGSRMLQISDAGADLLWESRRLKSKFAPIVHHQGTIYGLDDGVLTAIDPDSGERLWKRGRYGHGQFLRLGNLLLIQAEDGDLVLVEISPTGHRELARVPALDGKTWNPPALAGRILLVRNDREAVAFSLPTVAGSAL